MTDGLRRSGSFIAVTFAIAWLAGAVACGDDDGFPYGTGEYAGQSCSVASQCYANIDATTLHGVVVCLNRVEHGYCTHVCDADVDCCAVAGECWSDLVQVCSPFESETRYFCMLSCESADVADGIQRTNASPELTPDEYCARFAHPSFHCRSSGGGTDNRRVCVP